jgi:hypothetical protein
LGMRCEARICPRDPTRALQSIVVNQSPLLAVLYSYSWNSGYDHSLRVSPKSAGMGQLSLCRRRNHQLFGRNPGFVTLPGHTRLARRQTKRGPREYASLNAPRAAKPRQFSQRFRHDLQRLRILGVHGEEVSGRVLQRAGHRSRKVGTGPGAGHVRRAHQ